MNIPKATVYIVEDDPSLRKSTERLLRTSGYQVMVFESANSFLAQRAVHHPGCLLLDVCLPDMDGILLHQKLLENGDTRPIIFITGHGTIPMGIQAMKNGAVDFLPKPVEPRKLLNAIKEAVKIDIQKMREALFKNEANSLIDKLTPRELQILRWVITGSLNKQIAHHLGITEKTVKVHRSRVMLKTGVSSVAELVRLADRAGICPAN